MRARILTMAAAMALPLATNSHAATFTLFEEYFAEEAASIAPTREMGNFGGLDSFTVVNGTVDLFVDGGFFNLKCPSDGCLDLDGSTNDAARIESTSLSFLAGTNYVLSFMISGNQRGGAADTMTVGIDNGVLASQTITRNPFDQFGFVTLPFSVSANRSGRLFFDHQGGDNLGLILDHVTITGETGTAVVPAPAALPLLASALGLFATLGSRRSRRHT